MPKFETISQLEEYRSRLLAGRDAQAPDMVVGSRLTLQGVGAPFEGDGYTAVRVCHTYDLKSGHRTHFEAQRATVNG